MYITIIGLTLIATGSLGAVAGLIWLTSIRHGYAFPRCYTSINIRHAVIVTVVGVLIGALGFVLSDTRRIPDLFPVFLAGGSLAAFGVIIGLFIVARVRSSGYSTVALFMGAVGALVIAIFIWFGIPLGEGEPGAEGDYLSSLIFFGFALPFIAAVGGLIWLAIAAVRRRGRSAAAGFAWSAASLAIVAVIGLGIWMRVGEAPTIEGLELLAVTLDERPDAPMGGVYVHGSYAFVGGQSTGYYAPDKQGVRILDIADPASPQLVPQLVGRIPLRTEGAFGADHSHGDALVTHIESGTFQGDVALVLEGCPTRFRRSNTRDPMGSGMSRTPAIPNSSRCSVWGTPQSMWGTTSHPIPRRWRVATFTHCIARGQSTKARTTWKNT